MGKRDGQAIAYQAGFAPTWASGHPPAPSPVQFYYSAIERAETPLPAGLQPASLLQKATGADVIGELLERRASDVVELVKGSLKFIEAIAGAIPTDDADERLVDALVARSVADAKTRPLRRR